MFACAHMYKSEEHMWDLVLFFLYVGPRDGTRAVNLDGRHHLYWLGHFEQVFASIFSNLVDVFNNTVLGF